ncbi:MAG: carbamoyl-phosphate synthase domain-containing protein [Candidatus Marinimicrobia bacterium]|nr:carbamoyl-phosphate synthase domain-containing protein [Candidatus Neomarinimicrobiota bacterium]
MKAKLILENGIHFEGEAFGASVPVSGEVVFNTGMVGYPEALTDPSYCGQILTSTYPLVGNYGVPAYGSGDILTAKWESARIQAAGFVISNLSSEYNHWDAAMSLDAWLKKEGIPGISGIDTRALTKVLREHGSMIGKIVTGDQDIAFYDPNKDLLIKKVVMEKAAEYGRETRPCFCWISDARTVLSPPCFTVASALSGCPMTKIFQNTVMTGSCFPAARGPGAVCLYAGKDTRVAGRSQTRARDLPGPSAAGTCGGRKDL